MNMSKTPLHIAGMLNNGWYEQTFVPFREGIEICLLHDGTERNTLSVSTSDQLLSDKHEDNSLASDQPTIALLRYQPGASVPRHRHTGIELIVVLEGSQSDELGVYEKGSVVVNPVGSEHSVSSDNGCVVLIQWDKPVEFV